MGVRTVGLACAFCGWLASSAMAQSEADPAPVQNVQASLEQEARALFQAGRVAFDGGRFENALDAFTRAFEASGHIELVFNMAQCLDRLRRDAAAIAHYERFLESGPSDAHREYVEARLVVLRARHHEATELAAERDALRAEVERLRQEQASESASESESESASASASEPEPESESEAEPEAASEPMLHLRVTAETNGYGLAVESGTAYHTSTMSSSIERLYRPLCRAPCETELEPGTHQLAVERQGVYYRVGNRTRLEEDATLHLTIHRPIAQRVIGAVALITGLGLGGTFVGLLVSDSSAGRDDHVVRNAAMAGVGGALLLTGLITLMLAEPSAGVSVRQPD